MTTSGQVRGMLLEEAVLHLLRRSGYQTVNIPGLDPTLCNIGAGLAVRGRGCEHQIDAIADFIIHPPFSNPQRLMVEAKCYDLNRTISIDVIRNAVGVLKDTSEYWAAGPGGFHGNKRYHYQYAIFSSSVFSKVAQRYAFAQDVYLFPLYRSRFFRPILEAIWNVLPVDPEIGGLSIKRPGELSRLRSLVRKALGGERIIPEQTMLHWGGFVNLWPFIDACQDLNYALVAVLGGRFPVFLSPSHAVRQGLTGDQIQVRIFWDEDSWYLRSIDNEDLFSFDLPDEVFELYAEDGFLPAGRALDLKEELMSTLQAIETVNGHARIFNFVLDREWIETIRRKMD